MFQRLNLPAMLVAGAMALAIGPSDQLQASTCGGPGEDLCKENTSCVSIIFYSQCTTTFDYYSTDDDERAIDPYQMW
jgi:hypothetical protein